MKTSKSIYIHIPFCKHICGYCDFVKVGYHKELADKVLTRIIEDGKGVEGPISSIYIGGGTPSSLTNEQLLRLKDAIAPFIHDEIEVTIEINPETMDISKAKLMKEMGINRASIGIQAIQPRLLDTLTRKHTFADAQAVILQLRDVGISNISVDAMYGIENQTLDDFKETLHAFVSENVDHISLYALVIEQNTAFYKQNVQQVDNELEGEFYELAHDYLTNHGYDHYEVSSFAKNNKKSNHNLGYWKYQDFIGIGPGAASKIGCHRFTNTKNLNHYLLKKELLSEEVVLDHEQCLFEHIMMGLRLREGLNLNELSEKFNFDVKTHYQTAIQEGIIKDWLTIENNQLKTTYHGMLFLHDVLLLFMT